MATPAKVAVKPVSERPEKKLKPLEKANSLRALNDCLPKEIMTTSDLFLIDPRSIESDDTWNSRGAFLDPEEFFAKPSSVAHIRNLADSYIAGRQVPPMIVIVREGRVIVRDGHFRIRALRLALSEGAQILKVAVLQATGDETDHKVLVSTMADGMKLSVMDNAAHYQTFIAWGWDMQKIAKKHGVEYETVRVTLSYLALPLELKRMVQYNEVAAYYALEMFQEYGEEKAIEMLKAGKAENPKGKVTPRNVKKALGESLPKPGKKLVEAMRTGLVSLTSRLGELDISKGGDSFSLKLSRSEVESLLELKDQLEALKAAPKAEEKVNGEQHALPL